MSTHSTTMDDHERAFYSEIGMLVRLMRIQAGLSQQALAVFIGMSRTSVVNIEAGRQRVPIYTLKRIGELCNYKLTWEPLNGIE